MKNVILAVAIVYSYQVKAQTQTQDINMSTYQLQFPSSFGEYNRAQSSRSGTWLFKSRFDNIVFQSGENDSNPRDIIFGIGNTEKARLNTSGNFGIGIPTPDYRLAVNGGIRAFISDSGDDVNLRSSRILTSETQGLSVITSSTTTSKVVWGVIGQATSSYNLPNTATAIGVYGEASSPSGSYAG
ncbi:MAG: hypothetical protein MUC38_02750 [Cyclobacteriaceae bacterium]|nr:hypothetical protein [Cyclobacteriaceae bacterium]